jgi:hypothetical protein
LFVWRSPGSAHSLRKGDANDFVCFSWWFVATSFSPPFFGWRNKAGTWLRRWGCYLGLLGESSYSQLGLTRSSTPRFLKADTVHAWR